MVGAYQRMEGCAHPRCSRPVRGTLCANAHQRGVI